MIRNFTAAMASFLLAASANADTGIRVEHTGPANTIVRVAADSLPVLLLPVEDNAPDIPLRVIKDGRYDTTVFVRLARNKTDYFVPFDLTGYKDSNLLLEIETPRHERESKPVNTDVCWQQMRLSDSFDTSNREKYRPVYHHTPLYGWMNDPNGMFYKDGVWHLYYQYNPYGSRWQNMSWGHSTSRDLVNWQHQPLALVPDGLGSIFSGSAAIDSDNSTGFGKNAVVALYTSAGATQMQSLAHSNDNGATLNKHTANPVLTLNSEARDPNMFWNPDTKLWTIVLAHALEHEMLIFSSPDLKTWTLTDSFGKGLGAQNGVWECPDLMQLPVRGTDRKKWVMICNINPGGPFGGSATQYFVGDFDGKKFIVDKSMSGEVPTKWMDYGKDHYAAVSWSDAPDNRNVMIAWMSNWEYANDVPTLQFRSANTLPRDVSLFEGPDSELYLASVPSPEVDALRKKPSVKVKSKKIGSKATSFNLPDDNDGICEIAMNILPGKSGSVHLDLVNNAGDMVVMTYNVAERTFSFDRTKSGITDFSPSFPAVTIAPTLRTSATLPLRIFIDRSSIEVFDAEGNFSMTNLVFPSAPFTKLEVSSAGGNARVENLNIYPLSIK